MRTVVLGALALATGCNQIFGLDPVVLTDAAVFDQPPDGPMPRQTLLAITPRLEPDGEPARAATFGPIEPAPVVQYGTIGGELVTTSFVTPMEVTVGYDLAEASAPWRLVYTLPGGVPHEIHWQPTIAHPGRYAVLELSTDRDVLTDPAADFRITPSNPPGSYVEPRVYTTNAWTENRSPAVTGASIDVAYGMPVTRTIAGTKRVPDAMIDRAVLLENLPASFGGGDCTYAASSAVARVNLATGATDPANPPLVSTQTSGWAIGETDSFNHALALSAAHTGGTILPETHLLVTYGPAGGIPVLRHSAPGVPLPVPVGMTLLRCTGLVDGNLPPFRIPGEVDMPFIATIQHALTVGLAGGIPVAHGIVASVETNTGPPFEVEFALAIPKDPMIDGTSVKIDGQVAPIAIPAGGATATLTFNNEATSGNADYYEAILHRADGQALRRVREFTFTSPSLVFDREQGLPAGTPVVFEIRAIKGSRDVAMSDFTNWAPNQATAVTFTQAFTL